MPELPSQGQEQEKPKERTKESEITTNIELWQTLGEKIDLADIQREIDALPEIEGYNFYLYIPKGAKLDRIWEKFAKTNPVKREPLYDLSSWHLKMSRDTRNSYAVAAHYQQEPDDDSLGDNARSSLDWEKTDEQYMTPLEVIIAEMRWHKENGPHLNEKNITICPRSRMSGTVPCLDCNRDNGKVAIFPISLDATTKSMGVRKVITKNTKIESEAAEK